MTGNQSFFNDRFASNSRYDTWLIFANVLCKSRMILACAGFIHKGHAASCSFIVISSSTSSFTTCLMKARWKDGGAVCVLGFHEVKDHPAPGFEGIKVR